MYVWQAPDYRVFPSQWYALCMVQVTVPWIGVCQPGKKTFVCVPMFGLWKASFSHGRSKYIYVITASQRWHLASFLGLPYSASFHQNTKRENSMSLVSFCMTCLVVNGPWNIRLECHKHEGCGQNACSFLLNCNLKPISVTSRTVVEILSYWQICKSADKSIIATWRTCGGLWIKGPRFQPYLQHFLWWEFMCTYRGSEIQ